MGGPSLINLGDLSKPATVLIEKISNAIGWIAKPYQVIRLAKAKAKAEKINAISKIELQTTLERFALEERKKQENVDSIIKGALVQLSENAKPENIEDDWLAYYFEKCRIVSNKGMQIIWSKILAQEANSPGFFSKRTINTLAYLDRDDAILFTKLCGFMWVIKENRVLIFNTDHEIYQKNGINFLSLTNLQDIGLLSFDSLRGYMIKDMPENLEVIYFDKKCNIQFKKANNNKLQIGSVLLSSVGNQLATICGSEPVEGFYEFVLERWMSEGLKIESSKF